MPEEGKFTAQVNEDLLYEGPDGREAWLIFASAHVCIVTDIHGQRQPHNAAVFSPAMLRQIADLIEQRSSSDTTKIN